MSEPEIPLAKENGFDLCGQLCDRSHMATNIQLNEDLITEAQRLGKQPSKRATVEEALREYVQRRKQQEVIQLFGQIDYDETYDYKTSRYRR